MNKQTEALKMAIEALDDIELCDYQTQQKAIQACKEALEQPAQEPVAEYIWVNPSTQEQYLMTKITDTHPAPSWQGLEADTLLAIYTKCGGHPVKVGRAIEQALKEKNGG